MNAYRTIEVGSCQSCPFANRDNTYGYDGCNLSDAVTDAIIDEQGGWAELPNDKRHYLCPLDKMPHLIMGADQ